MPNRTAKRSEWRAAVSSTPNCLSLESLEAFLDRSPPARDQKAAKHLSACPRCQAELAMLREFEAPVSTPNDDAAVAWITAKLRHRGGDNSQIPAPHLTPWYGFISSRYQLAAAAALTIAAGISLYVFRTPDQLPLHVGPVEKQVMRGGGVRLVRPTGNLDRIPEVFEWEAFPGATKYSVELLEVDGTLIWKEESTENFLTSTRALRNRILRDKPFLWRVAALDASGNALSSSGQGRFRVSTSRPN